MRTGESSRRLIKKFVIFGVYLLRPSLAQKVHCAVRIVLDAITFSGTTHQAILLVLSTLNAESETSLVAPAFQQCSQIGGLDRRLTFGTQLVPVLQCSFSNNSNVKTQMPSMDMLFRMYMIKVLYVIPYFRTVFGNSWELGPTWSQSKCDYIEIYGA
jgi:hypothetical protein